MKHLLNLCAVIVLCGVVLVMPAHAEEKTLAEKAGTLPTSMWYWIDVLSEQFTLWGASADERPEILRQLIEEKNAEIALTITEVKEAAQAGERYEGYIRDYAKTIDVSNSEQYAAFVEYTEGQIMTLTGYMNTSELSSVPSFMNEIAHTFSDVHRTAISSLDGSAKTVAINTVLAAAERISVAAGAQAQSIATPFAQALFSWLADYLADQFTQLSAQTQAYVQAHAAEYLDQVKSAVIRSIQSIELPK